MAVEHATRGTWPVPEAEQHEEDASRVLEETGKGRVAAPGGSGAVSRSGGATQGHLRTPQRSVYGRSERCVHQLCRAEVASRRRPGARLFYSAMKAGATPLSRPEVAGFAPEFR